MKSLGAALIVFLVCSGLAHAQRLESFGRGSQPKNDEALVDDVAGEFNFVRVRFDTYFSGGGFRGGFGDGPWAIDFPDADTNFLRGVSRLTNIRVIARRVNSLLTVFVRPIEGGNHLRPIDIVIDVKNFMIWRELDNFSIGEELRKRRVKIIPLPLPPKIVDQ